MNHINSQNLKKTDLPKPNSTWDQILKFASTFDIQNEIPQGTLIKNVFDVSYSSSIPELRCSLYVDWRRYNHVGDFINEGTHEKAHEIIEWLREKI